MRNIVFSAFGIHIGGGLILMESMLPHISKQFKHSFFDERFIIKDENFCGSFSVVKKNPISRIYANILSAAFCKKGDILFCFNSLPPLTKSQGKVIVYVHAPHFVDEDIGIKYSFLTKCRIFFEKIWFKLGVKNVDEFWVQTPTMHRLLSNKIPEEKIFIKPFIDNLNFNEDIFFDEKIIKNSYFYPADAVGHKNHVNLLMAWKFLEKKFGRSCPKLICTLEEKYMSKFLKIAAWDGGNSLINLGPLPRGKVLFFIRKSLALIFPSKAETFGMPLIEARLLNKDIIASEKDFVRDVCLPKETFDPESYFSIASAVIRHMEREDSVAEFPSAKDFVSQIK